MATGLVVPCYNESTRWDDPYWASLLRTPNVIWTFVDGGSTDSTRQRLSDLSRTAECEILTLPTNVGKAEAVRLGMLRMLADDRITSVGFLDADGAVAAGDVERYVELAATVLSETGAQRDALWSSRVHLAGRSIERTHGRHYLGRIVATVMSLGHSSLPYDTQSGFKIFATSVPLAACLSAPFRTRWLFEVELILRWAAVDGRGIQIWEEPLYGWREIAGSKVSGSETKRIARESVTVKRMQAHVRLRNGR